MSVINSYTEIIALHIMASSEELPTMVGDDDPNVDSKEMVQLLVSLGAEVNTAKTLMCLHVHGPSKSSELQKRCNLRQPDVSIAINQLNGLNLIEIITTPSGGRGRPSHTYQLSVSLNEALKPFRQQAIERLSVLQEQLIRLAELTDSVIE
jgi:predicted transcriptional regulator